MGKSSVSVEGEAYKGEPVGLGPRVPMLAISPWSRGGFVNSQLFDHTSVIRFLEKRFGVIEPNITPWRRAVCGDLTTAFDFSASDASWDHGLPDTGGYDGLAMAQRALPAPGRQSDEPPPRQETGLRPARALPYALETSGEVRDGAFALEFVNSGAAGAVLSVYAPNGKGPWFYTVDAGQVLSDTLPLAGNYRYEVHGPNGFLRAFEDAAPYSALAVESWCDAATGEIVLVIRNSGDSVLEIVTQPVAYLAQEPRRHRLAPGERTLDRWAIAGSGHWYDIALRCGGFGRRWAGHVETGRTSRSDPALGAG